MGQPDLVSIIVPTRNSARFLAACLDSVVNQTYKFIELIVVDNESSDETVAIAKLYTASVYHVGPERSAQVNYGVLAARGEYVYKVDSDFVLAPDVVASCVVEISRGFDAIVVHNSPDVTVGWIARLRKFEVDMYKYDLAHSSARFVRKSVFLAVAGFDANITAGEDYDFQNRLNASGFRTGFVEPEALHLGEPRSFFNHMRKYYQYGGDFVRFADRNGWSQLRFVRRTYLRSWRKFLQHPFIGAAFIGYNACKYAAGGAGYVSVRLKGRRRRANA